MAAGGIAIPSVFRLPATLDRKASRQGADAFALIRSSDLTFLHTDTAAAPRSKAEAHAAIGLSDPLIRADARAGELAKPYDLARVTGLQC